MSIVRKKYTCSHSGLINVMRLQKDKFNTNVIMEAMEDVQKNKDLIFKLIDKINKWYKKDGNQCPPKIKYLFEENNGVIGLHFSEDVSIRELAQQLVEVEEPAFIYPIDNWESGFIVYTWREVYSAIDAAFEIQIR